MKRRRVSRRTTRRFARPVQESVIAALCLVIGLVFLVSIFLEPLSRKNLVFNWFGYAGFLVPFIALASGIMLFVIRDKRYVKRMILFMMFAVVLIAHGITAIDLLAWDLHERSSVFGLSGGLGGALGYLFFRLFLSQSVSIMLHVLVTAGMMALLVGMPTQRAVNFCLQYFGERQGGIEKLSQSKTPRI
jgi:hypothetical protein